jgi:hypothetical protein
VGGLRGAHLQRPVRALTAVDEARASGDDEVSVVSLTGGHAAHYTSNRCPRPSLWIEFRLGAPNKTKGRAGRKIVLEARLGGIFCAGAPIRRLGGE